MQHCILRYALARRRRQMGRVDWHSRQETIYHCVLCGRLVRMGAAGEVGTDCFPCQKNQSAHFLEHTAGLHRRIKRVNNLCVSSAAVLIHLRPPLNYTHRSSGQNHAERSQQNETVVISKM